MKPKKKTFLDELKQWRRDKEEQYAQVMMSTPTPTTILQSMPFPGVVLILGGRGWGKTGVGHQIAVAEHGQRNVPAMVHLPPATPQPLRAKIQKMLPDWMKVTIKPEEWEKRSVVIYDEAAQTAHARRTQSGAAVELDNLIGVSRQRGQLLIFICHHTKKLDPNVVREVNRIIWKRPTYAYQMFERDELTDFTMKAFDYFAAIRNGDKLSEKILRLIKRDNLMLDFDDFKFLSFTNRLPYYWTEQLSNLFEDITKVGRKSPG